MTAVDFSDLDLAGLDDELQYQRAVALVASATDDLLDAVRAMDDQAVRAPSLCPGWTRAHVITHLARNADAFGNLLEWARTGVERPMYASEESRDADIEAGSSRSASELEADLESASERLLDGLSGLDASHRHAVVRDRRGQEVPAHEALWWRVREVTYHHVDLDTGATFADVPAAVVGRGLPEAVGRIDVAVADSPDVPGLTLASFEGGTWDVGGGGATVRGSAADLLGWLTGREDGRRLRSSGPLPALPSWG